MSRGVPLFIASIIVGCSLLRDPDVYSEGEGDGVDAGGVGGSSAGGSAGGGATSNGGTSDSGACGNDSEPCCKTGVQCGDQLVCITDTCTACGAPSQFCCSNGACLATGFSCQSYTCQPCGGLNEPCCPGSLCENDRLNCAGDNFCRSCGDVGSACCNAGDHCNGGNWQEWRRCIGGICLNCCAVCQGEGNGPPSSGNLVNFKVEGDCKPAAANYCKGKHDCPGDACCSSNCVNVAEWSTCAP
jgi:hypothetical protein